MFPYVSHIGVAYIHRYYEYIILHRRCNIYDCWTMNIPFTTTCEQKPDSLGADGLCEVLQMFEKTTRENGNW